MSSSESERVERPTGRSGRYWRRVVLGIVLALVAFPASFIVRARFFPPTFDVPSIKDSGQYQDPVLLARAWALPAAAGTKIHFGYQRNGSVCGPSSLAKRISLVRRGRRRRGRAEGQR